MKATKGVCFPPAPGCNGFRKLLHGLNESLSGPPRRQLSVSLEGTVCLAYLLRPHTDASQSLPQAVFLLLAQESCLRQKQ